MREYWTLVDGGMFRMPEATIVAKPQVFNINQSPELYQSIGVWQIVHVYVKATTSQKFQMLQARYLLLLSTSTRTQLHHELRPPLHSLPRKLYHYTKSRVSWKFEIPAPMAFVGIRVDICCCELQTHCTMVSR